MSYVFPNAPTLQTKNAQYIAENIPDRQFSAQAPHEKWLPDVTEFHYYVGLKKHKVYISSPDAHPFFHSGREFQYTNRAFHKKLESAGMIQSMSRIAKCIDNGPMAGFWEILKRKRYYGRRFSSRAALVSMIEGHSIL